MNRPFLRLAISAAAVLTFAGVLQPANAVAVPSVVLDASNVGIGSISVSVVGTTITIEETWTSAGPGFLRIQGLEPRVDYTVQKVITNNSGVAWTRLANEILDPAGQANDNQDPQPYPAFVPAGFTTSNNNDGLSFAQGAGLPRTSSVFASVFADEGGDARDFLDFFDGTLANGAVDNFMTFGLRDIPGTNQPLLLSQRPNATSRVPEPASLLILGAAFAGVTLIGRKRRG
jgi:hypothetical protein